MPLIRTDRLVLRPPRDADVPALVAACSDADVSRYIPRMPVPYSEREAQEWLSRADERWRESREWSFAVTLASADELLGVISVRLRPGGSIGYWLRRQARGQGLMTEALRAVTEWASEAHGLRDLFLTAHPENVASQRVAEKAGFTRVGVVNHEPPFADGVREAVRFEQGPRLEGRLDAEHRRS